MQHLRTTLLYREVVPFQHVPAVGLLSPDSNHLVRCNYFLMMGLHIDHDTGYGIWRVMEQRV